MAKKPPCKRCGSMKEFTETLRPTGQHYSDLKCSDCGAWNDFGTKPLDDPTKYKRPNAHRDLVKKYGRGVCEMCCQKQEQLPKGQTLEAQHVVEYADGGSEDRENIWIVCTGCHRLIHWVRYYHGGDPKQLIDMIGKDVGDGSR